MSNVGFLHDKQFGLVHLKCKQYKNGIKKIKSQETLHS